MDYLKLLEHSFEMVKDEDCSRLKYLADDIFNFTTYDDEISELFATKAIEVCSAISEKKTFEYIENQENYLWYVIMLNMDFFATKTDYGTSIRGVWWSFNIEFESCGLYVDGEQYRKKLKFKTEEWKFFISAVIEFAAKK